MSENWQVQELDGTSIADYPTKEAAEWARFQLTNATQTGYRVRRTA